QQRDQKFAGPHRRHIGPFFRLQPADNCSTSREARRNDTVVRGSDMVETIQIKSGIDGYALPCLRASPESKPKGGVVVIQEIFGLTDHIAEMTQVCANAGYAGVAPGLFDRVEKNFHAAHNPEGIARAIGAVQACSREQVTADLQAAIDQL